MAAANRFLPAIAFAALLVLTGRPVHADPDAPVRALADGGQATVSGIVDGDTVLLADGREVRLVGIQAPKLPLGRRNFLKWPLADRARSALESLTLGRTVFLSYGGQRVDRHGRQLAQLTLDDGSWVQRILLSQGLARVYSFADNRALVAEMLAAERAARQARAGIWDNPFYAIRSPFDLARDIGTFQLVEGLVLDAARVRGMTYLNFGEDWRTDFTVVVRKEFRAAFEEAGFDLLALKGRRVRIRGWLDNWNGPLIAATHPEQIEVLGD
ncbi:MAG: thermonuclease family protein [Alphaproteobacteria bacterium]|nr:thermonuclease family protein [Alphaproteobacteria bacterium]